MTETAMATETATVTDSKDNNVDADANDSDTPRMCYAVVAVAALSVLGGGARRQQ
jgi:hypothetical protein